MATQKKTNFIFTGIADPQAASPGLAKALGVSAEEIAIDSVEFGDLKKSIELKEYHYMAVRVEAAPPEFESTVAHCLECQIRMKALIVSVDSVKTPAIEKYGSQVEFHQTAGGESEAKIIAKWVEAQEKKGRVRYAPYPEEIEVTYEKDGVFLFVDPVKVRRVSSTVEGVEKEQLRGAKIFMARVIDKLNDLGVGNVDAKAVSQVVSNAMTTPVKIAPPQEMRIPAELAFEITGDKLYATYSPPQGGGDDIKPEEAIKRAKKHLQDKPWFYFEGEARKTLEKKTKEPQTFLIAERRDGSFTLDVSQDKMDVYMTLQPPYGGEPADIEDVKDELERIGIVFGRKDRVLEDLFKIGMYGEKTSIAQGKQPVTGKNGWYEILWQNKDELGLKKQKDRINLREVKKLDSTQPGDELVAIYAPGGGEPGTNVFGEAVPAKNGRHISLFPYTIAAKKEDEFTLFFGDGTELNDNWTRIVSICEGSPQIVNGVVSVMPILEIDGDVDYEIGNIDFHGNVVIRGNILSKFSVKSAGSIIVDGLVEDAILEAGVDVILSEGIVGNERALIFARRNVVAKNIHAANVFAFGNIMVEEAIYHSRLICYEDIVVGKGLEDGLIVGGTAKAARKIEAAELGGVNYTKTTLEVGKNPWIKEEIEALREAYEKSRHIASKSTDLYRLRQKKEDLSKVLQQEVKHLPTMEPQDAVMHKIYLDWIDVFISVELDSLAPPDIDYRDRFLKIIGRKTVYPGVTAIVREDITPIEELLASVMVTPKGLKDYFEEIEKARDKKTRRRGE